MLTVRSHEHTGYTYLVVPLVLFIELIGVMLNFLLQYEVECGSCIRFIKRTRRVIFV